MSKEYWQKLKDPRWQKMRLEVMNREGFRCEYCGKKDDTLNVHHAFYEKGKEPWEYDPRMLHCVCESCHADWHYLKHRVDEQLACLPPPSLEGLEGFLEDCAFVKLDWASISKQSPHEILRLHRVVCEMMHGAILKLEKK